MSRRAAVAVGVIALWLAGLATLARREVFGGEAARLADAARFVAPGAQYYQVWKGEKQIGFASSTIDTAATTFTVADVLIAYMPAGHTPGSTRRVAARSTAVLTRTLRLANFSYELRGSGIASRLATGTVLGDTLLSLVTTHAGERGGAKLLPLDDPILVPGMLPMIITLGEEPSPGISRTAMVFNPLTNSLDSVTVHVAAESLFVLVDSAAYDAGAKRWVAAHSDTVRAWRIEQQGGGMLTGWFDGRGRMVEGEPVEGIALRRTAYELAFNNWRNDSTETRNR